MRIGLGNVKNLAMVSVNGKDVGEIWNAPYDVDATSARKPGAYQIIIKVVNAWGNRLIENQRSRATEYTFLKSSDTGQTRCCLRPVYSKHFHASD